MNLYIELETEEECHGCQGGDASNDHAVDEHSKGAARCKRGRQQSPVSTKKLHYANLQVPGRGMRRFKRGVNPFPQGQPCLTGPWLVEYPDVQGGR